MVYAANHSKSFNEIMLYYNLKKLLFHITALEFFSVEQNDL